MSATRYIVKLGPKHELKTKLHSTQPANFSLNQLTPVYLASHKIVKTQLVGVMVIPTKLSNLTQMVLMLSWGLDKRMKHKLVSRKSR